jgi:hypothetical protein
MFDLAGMTETEIEYLISVVAPRERTAAMVRMRRTGATYKEIGLANRISPARARQILQAFARAVVNVSRDWAWGEGPDDAKAHAKVAARVRGEAKRVADQGSGIEFNDIEDLLDFARRLR